VQYGCGRDSRHDVTTSGWWRRDGEGEGRIVSDGRFIRRTPPSSLSTIDNLCSIIRDTRHSVSTINI